MFRVSKKFLILLIVAFIFAFIQGGNLPYCIFYGIALTFFIGLIYIFAQIKAISVQVRFDKEMYSAGDTAQFSTIVKNYSILPSPYVLIKNSAMSNINSKYVSDCLCLNPDESKWIKNEIQFNQRGIYNFGDIYCSVSDMFYIFQRGKHINSYSVMKVYPRVQNISKFVSNGSDIFKNTVSSKTNIEDAYSTRDIRKYNEGDSLKRVNWKVSAKHGELYVKNFETVSGEESNLFLNMSKDNIDNDNSGVLEEALVDFCVSIVNYMQLKGIKSKLFINSLIERKFEVDSREDFIQLMEFFLTQKSDSESNFINYINSNLDKIPKLSWIGIITARIDDDMRDNLIMMKDKGYNLTVFYYANSLSKLENIKFLNRIGIQCLSFNEMINKAGN